jgi:hypothetical protein
VMAAQQPGGSYVVVEKWGLASAGEPFLSVSAVVSDPKGIIHAFRRDGNNIWTMDSSGKLLKTWGQGIAKQPHGIRVDREGFIWTTDGTGDQVEKWSADGSKLLMTLGKYEVAGETPDLFNRPADVAFAANGDFFVADGHGNSRIVKFTKDGKFIKAWGTKGTGPGQFVVPHSIVVDSRSRVLVADRDNKRVQIFDLDGKFLEQWTHFGSPSEPQPDVTSLYLTPDDRLYIADGMNGRVWITSARDGKLLDIVQGTDQIHWVAVDPAGGVYAASDNNKYLRKYVKR